MRLESLTHFNNEKGKIGQASKVLTLGFQIHGTLLEDCFHKNVYM